MEKNKWKNIALFFIWLLLIQCINDSPLKVTNDFYQKSKSTFAVDFKNLHLTEHFPNILNNVKYSFETSGVSSNCVNHNGYFYLIDKKPDTQLKLDSLIKNSIYTVPYSNNNNTIIDLDNLKHDTLLVEKCNKFFPNTKPIPYFEDYNFNLGYKTTKEKVKGKELSSRIYTVPKDLKVSVINAEAGDFWKENCNSKRPKSLKKWQHGYSRGVAVSDKENLIVYWTMLW